MKQYETTELGKLDELIGLENGKVFLHDTLALTGCEISVNSVPKGFKVPFNHKHKENEEVYIVLKGNGILTVDNEKIRVKEGSAVKVMPEAVRTLENASEEDFRFICIQTKTNSLTQFGLGDAELC
ncbi:cupin domain-containing protein [Taurinivorans muris]|jgi:Mannose-6-phosphate isomerase|uniref:Cupin domain-containing protein n=1 Tax=Taurinivorans muris TaxID=2787751 RepID=A0ABY5XZL7_9BACT|nr:cupin domain-containing protein [Desulfovibrionaceae bacterium LT0009]